MIDLKKRRGVVETVEDGLSGFCGGLGCGRCLFTTMVLVRIYEETILSEMPMMNHAYTDYIIRCK